MLILPTGAIRAFWNNNPYAPNKSNRNWQKGFERFPGVPQFQINTGHPKVPEKGETTTAIPISSGQGRCGLTKWKIFRHNPTLIDGKCDYDPQRYNFWGEKRITLFSCIRYFLTKLVVTHHPNLSRVSKDKWCLRNQQKTMYTHCGSET